MLLAPGWLWVAPVTGQPTQRSVIELDPVVVSATVAPTLPGRTSASVTVITREQIEAQQSPSVIDVLRQVPGVHIDQAGGRGSVSSVYTRGGDPNFTVVLIDGVKVNDPTNSRGGSFDFSTLSTEDIERIEIVRGPLSAVHGSDAMSGVINIITRKGTAKATQQLELTGGRYEYWRAMAQAQGMVGVMDYAVSGSYVDNGEPVEGSAFKNGTLYANIGVPPTDNMELRWLIRYVNSDAEAFPDDSGGPEFAVLRQVERRDIQELTLGMTLTHTPFPWWEYQFQFGLYDRQEDIDSPGVAPGVRNPFGIPPNATNNDFERYEFTLRHLLQVARGLQFALGAQAQFEDGRSTGSLDFGGFPVPTSFSLTRDIWAPFFEVQVSVISGLLVQGGVRIDLPEGFDTEVSPRFGASYTIAATGTTLRASWGEGFKLPSFFSLGNPIVGNPGLQPETSQSVDAGITQTFWEKRATISVTYFYNEFTDLIDFDEVLNLLVNRSKVTTEGVEMSLSLAPLSQLNFLAHLTYVKSDIKGTNEPLRNRPEWRGGFSVRWHPLTKLDVLLKALFVGEVQDSSIPTGDVTLDPYARVDLAVNWSVTSAVAVLLAVENLFDADYEEFVGFPAPGINPRLGVRIRF
jgi:outer membrane cobalamin receptor